MNIFLFKKNKDKSFALLAKRYIVKGAIACDDLQVTSVLPTVDTMECFVVKPSVVFTCRTWEAEQYCLNQFTSLWGPGRGQGKCIHLECLEVSRLQIKTPGATWWKKGGVTEAIIRQNEARLGLCRLFIVQASCTGNISHPVFAFCLCFLKAWCVYLSPSCLRFFSPPSAPLHNCLVFLKYRCSFKGIQWFSSQYGPVSSLITLHEEGVLSA